LEIESRSPSLSSQPGTFNGIVLSLRFKERVNVVWREIIQLCFPLQIIPASPNADLRNNLAIRKTSNDGTDPHHRRILHSGTVNTLLTTVKSDSLVASQATRMMGVSAHKSDQARGFRGEV